jgi:alpha-D-ribose 1-methylphosphonate 5-triphosphate synthase subunit PhnG
METLACAPEALLDQLWRNVESKPAYGMLRKPESGLVMVRARAGATGEQFNLGEMTVTRCSVRVGGRDGASLSGTAYVAGRSLRKAQIAAIVDALLQDPARHDAIHAAVIAPLEAARTAARQQAQAKAATTRVEFFTMVRGA